MNFNNVISGLLVILTFACLIQFLTEIMKKLFGEKIMEYVSANILAALLGVLFAFIFGIDIFECFGLHSTYIYVNYIITGLTMSAGAPAIYEFIQYTREQRKNLSNIVKEEQHED